MHQPAWPALITSSGRKGHDGRRRNIRDYASRSDQSIRFAALAAAHPGDLEAAAALNDRLAAITVSPTLEGFHRYVAAEIDAMAGNTESAEDRYEQAIPSPRVSGASFLDGIASVGLVTIRATTGRIGDALDGYRNLIDYWERTGGWLRQWTTLETLPNSLAPSATREPRCSWRPLPTAHPTHPPRTPARRLRCRGRPRRS